MDAEIKAKWVEALRSGKYKQGRKLLKHAGRYCCLGVLCDVAEAPIFFGDSWAPSELLAREQQHELADMNDLRRASFAEIADHIEKNILAEPNRA